MHGGAADFRPPQFGCKRVKSIYHRRAVSSKLTQFFVDIGLRRYFTCGFRRENSKDSVGFYIRPEDAYPRRSGRGRARGVDASRCVRAFREPVGGGVFVQYCGVVFVGFGCRNAAAHTSRCRQYGIGRLLRRAFDFCEFFARFRSFAFRRQIFCLCRQFVGELHFMRACGFCGEVFCLAGEGAPRFFARTPQGSCAGCKEAAFG